MWLVLNTVSLECEQRGEHVGHLPGPASPRVQHLPRGSCTEDAEQNTRITLSMLKTITSKSIQVKRGHRWHKKIVCPYILHIYIYIYNLHYLPLDMFFLKRHRCCLPSGTTLYSLFLTSHTLRAGTNILNYLSMYIYFSPSTWSNSRAWLLCRELGASVWCLLLIYCICFHT